MTTLTDSSVVDQWFLESTYSEDELIRKERVSYLFKLSNHLPYMSTNLGWFLVLRHETLESFFYFIIFTSRD